MTDNQGSSPSLGQRVSITIGNQQDVAFEAITAMNVEAQVLEYRHGNSPVFYPIKMPGLGKVGNVVLRNVVLTEASGFREWHAAYETGMIKPIKVVISVLNEDGLPALVWTLHNAWPTKITGADLEGNNEAVAVELLEFACESITVTAGKV